MSRRVVAYEGEGRHRRPIFSDPVTVELPINPPGPVERRLADESERNGFTPRIPNASLPVAHSFTEKPLRLAAAGRRGRASSRAAGLRAAHAESVTEPEEEPAVEAPPATPPIEPESRPDVLTFAERLQDLATVAEEARTAWSACVAARTAADEAEQRWVDAKGELMAAWRTVGLDVGVGRVSLFKRVATAGAVGYALGRVEGAGLADDPAIVAAMDRAETELEALVPDPTEPADDAPEVVTRRAPAAAPAQPDRPLTKQDRILAAVVPHAGDLAVIANLEHTDRGNVTATLHNAGKRGRLTAAMIAVLPAAFAKYRPAV